MSTAIMVQQRQPASPKTELQYDLHRLLPQHSGIPYDHDADEGSYVHSGQPSSYGSPAPMMRELGSQQSGDNRFMTDMNHYAGHYPEPHGGEYGLGINFEGYRGPGYYQHDGLHYHSLPYAHQGFSPNSPSTPQSTHSIRSEGTRRTRSGRAIARALSPQTNKSRVAKSPKPKKPKAPKANAPKTPKLTAPLSVLTKDYSGVPVRNMQEWVNRSPEVRRAEVAKRNGYITRPMNSFMLYRSAYAERTKIWCLQNNHQVVSSVSGESWPLEPPEVREYYNDLAKIERINHQNAHPTYKFSPSKTTAAAKKRKGEYSDEGEDAESSDLDDPDAEWGPPGQRKTKSKGRRQTTAAKAEPEFHGDRLQYSFGTNEHINKSAWNTNNGGKALPAAMGIGDLYHQYYQTTVHQNLSMALPGIEDVHIRPMHTPGVTSQSLIGLPGGQHLELLALHSNGGTPQPAEPQVDPMLLAYDSHRFGPLGQFSNGGYHTGGFLDDRDSEYGAGGEYRPEEWQVDPAMGAMEQPSEFEKWMDPDN